MSKAVFLKELNLLNASAVGVIAVRTKEPFRTDMVLREWADEKEWPYHIWDVANGWRTWTTAAAGDGAPTQTRVEFMEHGAALAAITTTQNFQRGVCVMMWMAPAMMQVQKVQHLLCEDVRRFAEESERRLILLLPETFILPTALANDVYVLDFALPDREELMERLEDALAAADNKTKLKEEDKELLVTSASGLTSMEAEVAFCLALMTHMEAWKVGKATGEMLNGVVLKSKTEVVKRSEVLELMPPIDIKDVGGLELAKEYIENRRHYFTEAAKADGVDIPKGIALVGPPRCLAGDTELLVRRGKRNSGRPITLETFYKKFNGLATSVRPYAKDADAFLHSFDQETGQVFFNRVVSVIDSGVQLCVEFTTESGKTITCTHDHPVLTEKDGFVHAGNLEVGDVVMAKGSMKPCKHAVRQGRKQRVVIEGLHADYEGGWGKKVTDAGTGKVYNYKRNHRARLVVEAQMNGMDYAEYLDVLHAGGDRCKQIKVIPSDYEVHHTDENPMNDAPDNLVLMVGRDHDRMHHNETKFNVEYVRLERITAKANIGSRHVYDVQMESPCNNFVANGIIVHNTGKSLFAKMVASVFDMPLIKFDIARVFGSMVGQSEERIRAALSQLEAMAPCVVLFDEADKAGIDPRQAGGDSGVSKRIIGSLLTFMQECQKKVYFIFTLNRVDNVPPELLGKGRLDDVFAVMAPNPDERRQILEIHLAKRKRDPKKVKNLELAVAGSEGYVGAEIEGAIKESVMESFRTKVPVTGDMIVKHLKVTRPASEKFKEDYEKMVAWAEDNARPSSVQTVKKTPGYGVAAKATVPRQRRLGGQGGN